MGLFLSMQDFLAILEYILLLAIVPFSLARNVYLYAGVATWRDTTINTNMCLLYLKNIFEVVYFK